MEKLSVFITTFNGAGTLGACLESVKWADDIVVLDSYSSDDTLAVAERYGARIFQHEFLGFGPQKQLALDKTRHSWALLLDQDEMASAQLSAEIRELLRSGPDAAGYQIPRSEQLFWQMNHPRVRLNHHLRLLDKRRGGMSKSPVHADPEVDGPVKRLKGVFYHFGETDIHAKVDKINNYSSGLVLEKLAHGRRANPWILPFYPPLVFFQQYLFKRAFLNGWAGFIGSVVMSFYAFLKHAKRYEHHRIEESDGAGLPECAPRLRVTRDEAGRIVETGEAARGSRGDS